MGGAIAARLLRRDRDWPFWLSLTQSGAALTVVGSMMLLTYMFQTRQVIEMLPLAVIAILPSAMLMGLSFPIALGMAAGAQRQPLGNDGVAELYAVNVIGAIAGSLATGFVLLPALGSRRALVALAGSYLIAAALVPRQVSLWRSSRWLLMSTAAFFALARAMPDPIRVALAERHGTALLEQWRDEGVQTVVSVRGSTFQHELYLNGLHQANDHPEMVKVHHAIGHLPMVLHGSPVDVLVVGLGGGATPGATTQYPGAHVEVVELSDGVRRAASFFRRANFDILAQPNVEIRVDDGRNFLRLTDRQFDVITADLIQPGHAGAGNLYSREYFELVRRALRDDGVALQWIGLYPPVEYALIMRTFLDVFPDATLWYGGQFMVGTKHPLRLDRGKFERLQSFPMTREALDRVGLTSFDALCAWYKAGPAAMRAFVGPGLMLSDDRPLLEYHWVPSVQPPLDLSSLSSDVAAILPQP
jgi:spermidine synthase